MQNAVMGEIRPPQKVNLFFAILLSNENLSKSVRSDIEQKFGIIEIESPLLNFSHTNYYKDEMGEMIKRIFFGMRDLIDSSDIVEIKKWSQDVEKKFSDKNFSQFKRPVNIDPGYIELSKVVLASTKNYFHRIHLRDGIYAEVTLHYEGGSYKPFQWTYPDYKTEDNISFFNALRKVYKEKLT